MRFEWDEGKSRRNRQKHGIDFQLATEVFSDPVALTIRDEYQEEERFWTIGRITKVVVVVVVHTTRARGDEEVTRIISARRATPRERRFYEETIE